MLMNNPHFLKNVFIDMCILYLFLFLLPTYLNNITYLLFLLKYIDQK
jgi:hypothetical protein